MLCAWRGVGLFYARLPHNLLGVLGAHVVPGLKVCTEPKTLQTLNYKESKVAMHFKLSLMVSAFTFNNIKVISGIIYKRTSFYSFWGKGLILAF